MSATVHSLKIIANMIIWCEDLSHILTMCAGGCARFGPVASTVPSDCVSLEADAGRAAAPHSGQQVERIVLVTLFVTPSALPLKPSTQRRNVCHRCLVHVANACFHLRPATMIRVRSLSVVRRYPGPREMAPQQLQARGLHQPRHRCRRSDRARRPRRRPRRRSSASACSWSSCAARP